jgi:hypothetical protein
LLNLKTIHAFKIFDIYYSSCKKLLL